MEILKTNNPMFCDPVTGICEIPESKTVTAQVTTEAEVKPVKLIYFTDPICSSCWGIEPQLKKLKLEYGDDMEVSYHMGGLLKSWDTYGGRDVSGPESVAEHWDEASERYQMPIDGNVWIEDPMHSSYPPSIAFKAAQLQDEEKATRFMRKLREMVFLQKKNITKWEHIEIAAKESGLESELLKRDFEGRAIQLFEEDLILRHALGVRGFPSIFFTDQEGNRFLVYGSKPYQSYEEALLKLFPSAKKKSYDTSAVALLQQFETLTTMEYALLSEQSFEVASTDLESLAAQQKISKKEYRNGEIWQIINNISV